MKQMATMTLALVLTFGLSIASAQEDVSQLLKKADSLVTQANYDSALAIEKVALSVAEEKYGADDTLVANVLMYMGSELCGFGRFEEARDGWIRALEIRKSKLGEEHPRVADCQMNLGIVSQRLQEYDQAEAYFQSARHIIVNTLGKEHVKSVTSAQNLFGFYRQVGRIDSAAHYAEVAANTSRIVSSTLVSRTRIRSPIISALP